jgi:hypothetical protein
MPAVQLRAAVVASLAHGRRRELVAVSADEMTQRVAAERVGGQQDEVGGEHERADANAELAPPRRRVRKPHCLPQVVRQHEQEQQGDIEEVAVDVLHDERESLLTPIALPWLTNGT